MRRLLQLEVLREQRNGNQHVIYFDWRDEHDEHDKNDYVQDARVVGVSGSDDHDAL